MRFGAMLAAAALFVGTVFPAAAQTAGTDPFVFVSEIEHDGTRVTANGPRWYLLDMTIRPTGTSVAGVPISAVNAFLERQLADRPAITPERWCFANALSQRSYVSANRHVQANIDELFRENPEARFQMRGRFTGEGELLALVGHYEDCGGEAHGFIMILETSGPTPTIVHVDTLPYVSGLQYMRMVDGNITVSTCFECGDVSGLFFDPRRRRWYWEALGD